MRRLAGAGVEAPHRRGHLEWTASSRRHLVAPNCRDPTGLHAPATRAPGIVVLGIPTCESRTGAELGTSMVGTLVGFLIVMTLLLFCTQVVVRLYATSTLTTAAARAAEDVAESPDPVAEVPFAETDARQQLGTFGATRTRFEWLEVDAQQIVLEVRGDSPSLLPLPGGWKLITRTVTIRTERFR